MDTERGVGVWTWLALLASLLAVAGWSTHEWRRSELASAEAERIEELRVQLSAYGKLAKKREELGREIASLEGQLIQLDRMVPPSLDDGWEDLRSQFPGIGLRWLDGRVLAVEGTEWPGYRRVVAELRVGRARLGWYEALARIEQCPLVVLIRRLAVEDPRHPESEALLELVSFVRDPSVSGEPLAVGARSPDGSGRP